MLGKIEALGERMLTRLVPRTRAAASTGYWCWNDGPCGPGIPTTCLVKKCCYLSGSGTTCTCAYIC
ncbi:hypothetical protein ACQPZ8_09000 [Actinomadura nitritigenes]|uniref:hypothetical protein n=1 Tax=Actinomadura nitritigenes TaxID=134602 RepID=UPI003D8A16F2